MRRLAAAMILAATLPARAAEPVSEPAEWVHFGLLRVRDLTPFGILRLDFLPAHAVPASKGTWGLEVDLSYQNTYVLSDNVAEYLRDVGGGRRVPPESIDVEAILETGEEAYLVDGELGLFDLTAHYRFSRHWGGYLTLPVLVFNDGVLDSTIERFHDAFRLESADRELVARNTFFALVQTSSGSIVTDDPPEDGFADPVLGLRGSWLAEPRTWNLIVESAAKLALGDAEFFPSSGRNDYGIQLSYQRFFPTQAVYVTASVVDYNGWTTTGPISRASRRSRAEGSTSDVDFWTGKDVREVVRSHVNYVVADTQQWEQSAAAKIDRHPAVESFVKNAGLGSAIPYLHNGEPRDYVPDFLVRLRGDTARVLILETKGFDPLEEVKRQAAERWVRAVNADACHGRWSYAVAKSVDAVDRILEAARAATRCGHAG
jgi:hypothetical protein